jgi:hypothetical protein
MDTGRPPAVGLAAGLAVLAGPAEGWAIDADDATDTVLAGALLAGDEPVTKGLSKDGSACFSGGSWPSTALSCCSRSVSCVWHAVSET